MHRAKNHRERKIANLAPLLCALNFFSAATLRALLFLAQLFCARYILAPLPLFHTAELSRGRTAVDLVPVPGLGRGNH